MPSRSVLCLDDAFGEQEAGGQLLVVAGRAHGHGQGAVLALAVGAAVAEANFKRLFGGELVGGRHGRATAAHLLNGGEFVAGGGQQDGGEHGEVVDF